MKLAKSILMGTGSVVLAGLILTLLVPKAAHAIAAAAVLVENTSANPVPTQDGRTPFVATCTSATASFCYLTPTVPAGKTFVAQLITIQAFSASLPTSFSGAALQSVTTGVTWDWSAPIPAVTFGSGAGLSGSYPVNIYQDAGTGGICAVASAADVGFIQCAATGYLIPSP